MNMDNEIKISKLTAFIGREYGIFARQIAPAQRGYYGETWRLDAPDGSYFIKSVSLAFHRPLYERSFAVMDALRARGIDYIGNIVKTKGGRLYSHFDGATVGVFDWIDGENRQDDTTKPKEYDMLCGVYAASPAGLSIPAQRFSCEKADLLVRQIGQLSAMPQTGHLRSVLRLLEENRSKLAIRAERLRLFANRCAGDTSHFYITHGDAGGNVMVNGNVYHLVDWDDPVYAPPERDAWFCLHMDWAMRLFGDALDRHGVDYQLRPDRLAFYCYHSFFWYLTLYLDTYLENGAGQGAEQEICDYFGCWIEDNIKFADTIA